MSSFARAYNHSFIVYFGYFPSRFNQSGRSIIEMIEFRLRRFEVVFQLRNSLRSGGGAGEERNTTRWEAERKRTARSVMSGNGWGEMRMPKVARVAKKKK